MKKTIVSVMGLMTVFALTLGVYTSTDYNHNTAKVTVKTNAHGDTGG
ncbi:hypothetical protein [Bacillus manliponensis]